MKAQVAVLESAPPVPSLVSYVIADRDDDVATIRQKLADLSGQRVAVVLHAASDAFDSPIAVHLLGRAAEQESIAMAIVTRRRWTRYWANLEGIKTFARVGQVPREVAAADPFASSVATVARETLGVLYQSANWLIALGFILGIAIVTFLVVPRAVVYVQPVTADINAKIPVTASINTTTPDAAKGVVPGRMLYLLVNTRGTIPVTHMGQLLDGRAVGYVTFENRSSDRQTIPAGTEVSTFSGVNFHTLKQIVLDPRPGASAQVMVRADYAGPASDVRRGDVTVIQGNLHWFATVVNEDVITGGGSAGTPIVTSLDTNQLIANVTADAEQQAHQELANETGPGELAVPESIQVTPIDENFDHNLGDTASELALDAQFRVSALIVNQSQIEQVALQNWQPTIQSGFILRGDSVQVASPVVTNVDAQGASFSVPIQAVSYKSINATRLAEYVRLRTPSEAEKSISQEFGFAAPPTIKIVPNWINRAYRVDVVEDTGSTPANAGRGTP